MISPFLFLTAIHCDEYSFEVENYSFFGFAMQECMAIHIWMYVVELV